MQPQLSLRLRICFRRTPLPSCHVSCQVCYITLPSLTEIRDWEVLDISLLASLLKFSSQPTVEDDPPVLFADRLSAEQLGIGMTYASFCLAPPPRFRDLAERVLLYLALL
jgi:hypothetical protein